MIVLVLLIVAAVVFGFIGFYGALPPRADRSWSIVGIGLCVLSAALAFWHSGQ